MPAALLRRLLHLLTADTPALSRPERRRASVGALLSVALSALVLPLVPGAHAWLMAPIGASVVILFALSHSPLAQPWPVFGSYLVATLTGLACVTLIPHAGWAAAVSVGLTVWLMARLHCLHPPGGALALLIVHEHHGRVINVWRTLEMVGLNVGVLLLGAVLIHRLLWRRPYPYQAPAATASPRHQTGDASPLQRGGLDHTDLAHAVQQLDSFVDVQESELITLYNLAVSHAFERHVGLTCGDIMSRDVVTVEFATELEEAWQLLRRHKVKALPVVDKFQRLIGILTVADFLRQLDDTRTAGLAASLQGLLRRTPGPNSNKAEVVGQIMSAKVITATPDTPVATLVQQLSDQGLHRVPIIDARRQVLGMVTQSDLIAALYKRIALSAGGPGTTAAASPLR
jgi:CBS domain-containing membrane protein